MIFLQRNAVLVIVALVRLLFVATYPPNYGGDTTNYLYMLTQGQSSLVFSPGYPFLMGLLWRHHWGLRFIKEHPAAFSYLLVLSHHAVALAALVVMERTLSRRFGRTTATIAVVLYGIHWQVLGATSSFYPEWLQASLLILACCAALRAMDATNPVSKAVLYAVAAFLFAWAYLTKFNALFMLPLVALPLLADQLPWRRKLLCALLATAVGVLTCLAFVVGYHRPSTGTYILTHDKAWVLLFRLKGFVPEDGPPAAAGVNTKRLLLLNSLLPWEDDVGPISHIDYGLADQRAEYRRRYGYLLSADERTLDELLARTPPQRRFNFFTAFHPSARYIGLAESDALGVRVYLENVLHQPRRYAENVLGVSLRALVQAEEYPFFPLLVPDDRRQPRDFGFVFYRQDGRRDFWNLPYYYRAPYLWLPGTRLFAAIASAYRAVPVSFVSLVIVAGLGAALIGFARDRRWSFGRIVYLVVCVQIGVFILCSTALVPYFRWKEAHLSLPFVCMLLGMSLATAWWWITQIGFGRVTRRLAQEPR